MGKLTILHNEYTSFVEENAGVSILIEVDEKHILFDTSIKSDIFENAKKISYDLSSVNYVVLSHGHYDHTDGLKHLTLSKILQIIAHPNCFQKKFAIQNGKETYIGCPLHLEYLQRETTVILSKTPHWIIPEKIAFLGEIPRLNNFEGKSSIGYDCHHQPDYVDEDSAIVIKSVEGLIIISGCSHSGICNIVEYAKKICQDERIFMVVGGFHLFETKSTDLTIQYFQKLGCQNLYPMHCLSDDAFAAFSKLGAKRLKTLEHLYFL